MNRQANDHASNISSLDRKFFLSAIMRQMPRKAYGARMDRWETVDNMCRWIINSYIHLFFAYNIYLCLCDTFMSHKTWWICDQDGIPASKHKTSLVSTGPINTIQMKGNSVNFFNGLQSCTPRHRSGKPNVVLSQPPLPLLPDPVFSARSDDSFIHVPNSFY